jgi:two-component system sensor histidine kinase QseC
VRLGPRSLQGRVLALVLGLLALVWGTAAAWTWRDVRHELDELLDSHLAQAAALLVVQQARELGDDDGDHAVDAPSLHRYAPKVAFQVFHEERLALRSANAPLAPMAATGSELRDGLRTGYSTVRIAGVEWRVFAATGAKRDVQVFVGEQVHSRSAILRAALRSTLAPLALALPLLGLGAWWAVAGGLRPLRRLGRVLAERSPQALEPVVVDGAPSEMQPMVDALNGLLARIGALMQAERRFTADAAHELRTPIAAIRAQAQVALAETDEAARRHALQATLSGCDRATRLVEQMLTLSRLEAGAAPVRAPLDLAALARQEVAALAERALAKRQDLALEAETPCAVHGDGTLLAVMVRNLVDNAVRYAPQGSRIRVAVAGGGTQRAELLVEDSGPGLRDDDLHRLGERFFRAPGSGESGSGLGWSIVQRIAAVQGATVDADRSPALGGLRVRVADLRGPVA